MNDPSDIPEGRVGTEGFQRAEMLIVQKGAVEAEGGCLWAVDEVRGIGGAHLEEDAHLEFGEQLSRNPAADVVPAVDGSDDMDSRGAAFTEKIGKDL